MPPANTALKFPRCRSARPPLVAMRDLVLLSLSLGIAAAYTPSGTSDTHSDRDWEAYKSKYLKYLRHLHHKKIRQQQQE